jgi:hypothetical protein
MHWFQKYNSFHEPLLVAPQMYRRSFASHFWQTFPTNVRWAFPTTFLISGEFRFYSEVHLVVLYAIVYLFVSICCCMTAPIRFRLSGELSGEHLHDKASLSLFFRPCTSPGRTRLVRSLLTNLQACSAPPQPSSSCGLRTVARPVVHPVWAGTTGGAGSSSVPPPQASRGLAPPLANQVAALGPAEPLPLPARERQQQSAMATTFLWRMNQGQDEVFTVLPLNHIFLTVHSFYVRFEWFKSRWIRVVALYTVVLTFIIFHNYES